MLRVQRPVIGISATMSEATYPGYRAQSQLSPRAYVDAVQRAGAVALVLPAGREPLATGVLELVDGLLLAGGADIDPAAYGAPRDEQTVGTTPRRDAFELELARAGIAQDMPIVGVCRGMQLLNVALGGTLHQHVPALIGHDDHRRSLGSFAGTDHDVRLVPGSLAARVIGAEHHSVKSHHHQAVDRLGEGLEATGFYERDGMIEAVELPDRRFVLGIQWHPEADPQSPVIGELVRAAERRPGG